MVKAGTAVQSFIDQPIQDNIKFQAKITNVDETSKRKFDGYRNPICDATTVSSKKPCSTSPPNQRSQNEETSASPISPIKRGKKAASKTSSNCEITKVQKREK